VRRHAEHDGALAFNGEGVEEIVLPVKRAGRKSGVDADALPPHSKRVRKSEEEDEDEHDQALESNLCLRSFSDTAASTGWTMLKTSSSPSATSRHIVAAFRVCGMLLLGSAVSGCGKRESSEPPPGQVPNGNVQGTLITAGNPVDSTNTFLASNSPVVNASQAWAALEKDPSGFLRLGFDRLSSFKYEVYEYYTEGVSGRPLLKSDDVIPESVRNFDGLKASIRGFVLPLRTRKGKVTEFLLLRDQGTCCFGPQAQINHFIRVNHPRGTEFDPAFPYRVRGVLRVGETYVQGYLTGIYRLEAESVERSTE
jgi:hypothetical protein